MNLFEAKSIYDSKTGKFIEEFYINGESVDCDLYYFYLEREKDIEDKKLEEDKVKEIVKETVDNNPYEYSDCDNCEECKGYINNCKCDECCGECECGCNCDEEEFDYGELLEIFTCRIINAGKDFQLVKTILDEFADIFIPDYDEDEFEITEDDIIYEPVDKCNDCEDKQVCLDISVIEHFFDKIENLDCDCDSCVKNVLYELFMLGKKIGWNDCEKEFVDDVDNKSDFICNLTVNVNNMSGTKEDINTLASKIINGVKRL